MRLGHSVAVAERNYLGLVKDISREARTLEAAMGIEELAARIVERAGGAATTGSSALEG